ncbi:hypothetical protein AB835_11755 [Candidatus Endobugula sertula]|uniref:Bacterial mobilisation domain-containing protein n=1 Tax=Candidatus Endobugula sertula TaxID=62101 RepID=A0A1D2QMR5_9GAMM|nr:hypothetical protein AB835_11755 [Candidatus Endobugula sertula]
MNEKRREYQQQYREKYKSQAKRVNLTFSQDEYRAFSRVAKAENEKVKVTTYIKQLALAGLEQQAHIPEDIKAEFKTLRFAIHNIANNVNQMAHYSNTVRNMTMSDEKNLLQYLKQLDDVIQSYTEGRILEGGQGDDDH